MIKHRSTHPRRRWRQLIAAMAASLGFVSATIGVVPAASAVPTSTPSLDTVPGQADESAAAAEASDSDILTSVQKTFEDANGVIHYTFEPSSLPGAVRQTQTGFRTGSEQCTFSESGSGQAGIDGPSVSIVREISYDPSTCVRELAVARYELDAVPSSYVDEVADLAEGEESTGQVAMQGYSWTGSLKVNVEDPAQIDVSTTKSTVQWSGSSCVTSSKRNSHWNEYGNSFWSRYFKDYSHGQNCSRAYANTLGKYRNAVFCRAITGNPDAETTYTNHKKTWFQGEPGGGYYWSYSVDKSGGCDSLLHYERIVSAP